MATDGPNSPAAKNPALGTDLIRADERGGVVVGLVEQAAAPPVAGEQQGAVGLRTPQEEPEVLVRRYRVPQVELEGGTRGARRRRRPGAPVSSSMPTTVRTMKSPRPNSPWCPSTTNPTWRPPDLSSTRSSGGRPDWAWSMSWSTTGAPASSWMTLCSERVTVRGCPNGRKPGTPPWTPRRRVLLRDDWAATASYCP